MSFAFKMQQELHQVESQIYDLETIFLSTNRYGKLSLSTDFQESWFLKFGPEIHEN